MVVLKKKTLNNENINAAWSEADVKILAKHISNIEPIWSSTCNCWLLMNLYTDTKD